jgi:homocitrate synthase
MCPHANGDSLSADPSQMVSVDTGRTNGLTNGANGHSNLHSNGRLDPTTTNAQPRNPYAPRYAEFLSNISNFNIIESTLRGV